MDKDLAVVCKNVKKSYGKGEIAIQALRGINLEIKKGELLMLVGPSGSGKTTLLCVIAGLLNQDEGECLVFNENLNSLPEIQKTTFRGKNIGFVFQSFNLIPMLNCVENIAIPLILNGTDREQAFAKAKDTIKLLGLEDRCGSYPNQLSGGQQQRIAIARSFIHNPSLIVCDEPTSSLDHETGKKVLEILRENVVKDHRSVIVVTHDIRIFEFADRIVHIEDGLIVSEEKNSY